MILAILFTLNALAAEPITPDASQTEFETFFRNETQKIIKEKNKNLRWKMVESLRKKVSEYETRNNETLSIKARLEISSLLVTYLPIIPFEADFDLKNCSVYRSRILEDSAVNEKSKLGLPAKLTLEVVESLCKK